jgi:zinc transporter
MQSFSLDRVPVGTNVGGVPFNQEPYGFAVIFVLLMIFTALAGWLVVRRRE